MRVPDQADPVRLSVEAQLGLERREHVLPDRIPGARVEQADVLLEVGGLELVQVLAGLGRDHALGPSRRERGAARELLERERAADAEVVVAGEADRRISPGQLDARVGLGAVADEVAEAPHLLAVRGLDRVEHRLEGMPVAVDVRNDCDSHLYGGLVASAATVLRVRHPSRHRFVESMLLALAAAEGGVRLLSPRERPIEPAEIDLHSFFSDAEIERGARFARPQLALGLTRAAIEIGALARVVRRPPRWLSGGAKRPVLAGAVTGAGLAVGLSLPTLPLSAISRRRGMAVGLVTQSWRGWAGDLLKGAAIESVLAAAAGGAAVAVTRRYPSRWWLPASAGSVLFGAGLAALAPVVLDPVFNEFTPLPEGETRSDVLDLARAAGVKVGEVYSVDASRRTTAANAYVAGLGPTKRVVLFDTLLDRYSRDEIRVVVAHELAHVRNRDVPAGRGVRGARRSGRRAGGAAAELGALARARERRRAPGARAGRGAGGSARPRLIGNRLSRAIERRSDAYSLTLTDAPDAFISFERAIAVQNVADLEPPRWFTSLLATHPPTAERIGSAVSFAGRSSNGSVAAAGYSSSSSGSAPRFADGRRTRAGS